MVTTRKNSLMRGLPILGFLFLSTLVISASVAEARSERLLLTCGFKTNHGYQIIVYSVDVSRRRFVADLGRWHGQHDGVIVEASEEYFEFDAKLEDPSQHHIARYERDTHKISATFNGRNIEGHCTEG